MSGIVIVDHPSEIRVIWNVLKPANRQPEGCKDAASVNATEVHHQVLNVGGALILHLNCGEMKVRDSRAIVKHLYRSQSRIRDGNRKTNVLNGPTQALEPITIPVPHMSDQGTKEE
jgi:hypothetical protein